MSQVRECRREAGSLQTCQLSELTTVCCVFARHFNQNGEARILFHKGCDVTVDGACEQISLPVTKDTSIFNLRRSFANGDGINGLPRAISASRHYEHYPKLLGALCSTPLRRLYVLALKEGFRIAENPSPNDRIAQTLEIRWLRARSVR